MAPLKPKDTVYTKAKPHTKGVILRAAGKHLWEVQFEGGSEETQALKSQQLIRSKPVEQTENGGSTRAVARDPPPAQTEIELVESSDSSNSSSNSNAPAPVDDEPSAEAHPPPSSDDSISLASSASSADDDSDIEELLHPFPPPPPNTDANEEEEEDVLEHGEIAVEPEEIHKAKWEQYKLEKSQLLSDGWTISRTRGSGNNSISIGSQVATKGKRNVKEGLVIGQSNVDGRKLWIVDFGNGSEPEPMRHQQLVLCHRNQDQTYVWKLVEDSEPETEPVDYSDGIGLSGLNFAKEFKSLNPSGEVYNRPYLKLLERMWPGDWRQQLHQLNQKIASENTSKKTQKNFKAAKPVSEQEWWVFVGIILSAGSHGKGGTKLWDQQKDVFSMTSSVAYGPRGLNIMAEYRFKEVKMAFPWSFQDVTKKPDEDGNGGDPWHMVLLLVDGFNANRHAWVAASARKILDESMSAWKPQTTKTGGLPHLSFILRKPEPLGTEFKTLACAVTGKKQSNNRWIGCRL
jgi:hypothetical protein